VVELVWLSKTGRKQMFARYEGHRLMRNLMSRIQEREREERKKREKELYRTRICNISPDPVIVETKIERFGVNQGLHNDFWLNDAQILSNCMRGIQ